MNIMVKVNRAFRAAKASVTELDNGNKAIAQKTVTFAHDGKRMPLTLQCVRDLTSGEAKMEMIIWDTRRMIQGRTVSLNEVSNHIPGFLPDNILFSSEIETLMRKSLRSRKTDDYGRDLRMLQYHNKVVAA